MVHKPNLKAYIFRLTNRKHMENVIPASILQSFVLKHLKQQIKNILKNEQLSVKSVNRKLTVDKSAHVFLNVHNTPLENAQRVQLIFLTPNNSDELLILARITEKRT